MSKAEKSMKAAELWGIGEWYGRRFDVLGRDERCQLAELSISGRGRTAPECPFRPGETCNKAGGVCTLARYSVVRTEDAQDNVRIDHDDWTTVCPARFQEGGLVTRWVGETLLGTPEPRVITEVDFLRHPDIRDAEPSGAKPAIRGLGSDRAVGRIDTVLVDPTSLDTLRWCALEMQAVYFSGASMAGDLAKIRSWTSESIPAPAGRRRPDWRSSGPKRLMPQLQIKVPTLRRWGKKTAVVVDQAFFRSMASMAEVADVSNCDIAWFVVEYAMENERAVLRRHSVHLTTLERAVEGLTAGLPVSQAEFEARLRIRLNMPE